MAHLDAVMDGVWRFDPDRTRIGFAARHAMVTTVRGRFTDVEGTVHVYADDVPASRVVVRLGTASVDTQDAERDEHLRGPDLFDAERYPEIRFVSSTVDETDENHVMVVGDLTIKDVTRQVAIPVVLLGVRRDPTGALRADFEATRHLNRRDFGLHWNMPLDTGGVLVSEQVTLEFAISAIRQES